MAENNFEKTEAPTPRKREEARNEGNVPKSQDLTAACALLAAVCMMYLLGGQVLGQIKVAMEIFLSGSHAANPGRLEDMTGLASYGLRVFLSALLPLALSILAVVLAVNIGQVGFLVTVKPVTPKISKLSPLRGIKNLFNARAAMRFVMSLGKLAAIAALAGFIIYNDLGVIVGLVELEAAPAFVAAAELVFTAALKLAALLIVLAILDFTFQRWQHERDLRMSKQEVKEEMKRMEGDPLVKQRRTQVARQLAMQRTAQAVPSADVIVTNPTHFSVALQYDPDAMRAPKLVAKGADFLAMRIRQIGSVHGIPIIERKPLARALYDGVEVGQEIPPEHYAAVAEILAYVYRLGEKQSA